MCDVFQLFCSATPILLAGESRDPRVSRQGKAKKGKARQDKARQGKAKQGKARQGKAKQGKARSFMFSIVKDTRTPIVQRKSLFY
jgi:hypothetical protein